MLKQDNTAVRLLHEELHEEKLSQEDARSKKALKVIKKEKSQEPRRLMPKQEPGYIKPPRYDFF